MYKIIGANQAEYGPVSAGQVRQWIAEGRINAQTSAQAAGETEWKPISTFPEFTASFPSAGAPPPLGMPPLSPAVTPAAGRANAVSEVTGPAIAMMIVGILGIATAVCRVVLNLFGVSLANLNGLDLPGQNPQMLQAIQTLNGTVGIVFAVIQVVLGLFIFYGGLKMKSLQQHTLCIVASIVAIIPCNCPCCCIGIPIGIWALIVLNKADVRDYFS